MNDFGLKSLPWLTFTLVLSLGILTGASPAQAKVLKTNTVSFEVSPRWHCQMDQSEWVCLPRLKNERGEAIIVVSAKQAGPQETFSALKHHLNTPRVIPNQKGIPTRSKVIYTKEYTLNNHRWVLSLHLGSEVDGFYSKYLATIQGNVAVLISLSADQMNFKNYDKDFKRIMQTVTLHPPQKLHKKAQNQDPVPQPAASAGPSIPAAAVARAQDPGLIDKLLDSSPLAKLMILAALLLIGATIYSFVKK